MSHEEQECLQCGQCCERWGWGQKGKPEDLVPWIAGNRHDILQHVSIRFADGRRASGTGIMLDDLPHISRISYWQDAAGRKMRRCPFLKDPKTERHSAGSTMSSRGYAGTLPPGTGQTTSSMATARRAGRSRHESISPVPGPGEMI